MSRTEQLALEAGLSPSHVKMLSTRQFRSLVATVRGVAAVPPVIANKIGLRKARSKCRLALRALSKCAVYLPYSAVDTVFNMGDDAEVLREFGIEMPPGRQFFDTVCRYALAAQFGKTPPASVDLRIANAENDLVVA